MNEKIRVDTRNPWRLLITSVEAKSVENYTILTSGFISMSNFSFTLS